MKMRLFTIIIVMFFCFPLSAQQFELGKVSRQELQEKFHPVDTSATAAILYKKGRIYFKYVGYWLVINEVETRIKIYKKDGYKFGTQELRYYVGNSDENTFSDACTYNIIRDSIVKTKMGSDGEFTEAIGKYSEKKKIVLPNVREGSVIEYKSTTITSGLSYLPVLYFQYGIPLNNIVYDVALPAYFNYHSIIVSDFKINKSDTKVGKRDGFQENRLTYSASDIVSLKSEPYVNNIENYRSVIKHELSAATSFNGEQTDYTTSWKTFVKKLYNNESFGGQLGLESYFRKDLDALLNEKMGLDEKAQVVFKYVQSRMNWDKYDGYFCYDGVKKAYNDRKGNVAEINLMLIAMLKYAGIPVQPVLISTRSNGIPTYPSFAAFDYVVASAQIGGKTILMDATSKNTVPGLLSPKALNWIGRSIQPDGIAIEVSLIPNQTSKTVFSVFATIDDKGGMSGKVRNQFDNYAALIIRESERLNDVENYVRTMEKAFHGAEISNYILLNEKDPEKLLVEEYSFFHNRLADLTSDRIFFNPMLFLATEENPFTEEKRLYPVDFIYPYQYKYMITLNLPEGYLVESVPESLSLVLGNGVADFKYTVDAKNNQIQLKVTFNINETFIENENYDLLKGFYKKMVEKQTEKIVLKKV